MDDPNLWVTIWDVLAKVVPIIAAAALAFIGLKAKQASDSAKKSLETTKETQEMVAHNTAVTEQIQQDISGATPTAPSAKPSQPYTPATPGFSPLKRP